MATKDKAKSMAGAVAWYDKLVSTRPGIDRKGASLPYTSHKGHMFTFLSAEGTLAMRLSENDREQFMRKYKTTLMEAHGVVMKEYVRVPQSLLAKPSELKPYFDASYKSVGSLQPKGTKGTGPKKKKKRA